MVKAGLAMLLALVFACSEPILHNVPQPAASTAGGVAAAAAAAATLADPDAAAKNAETARKTQEREGAPPPQGVTVRETVPRAVFDRLDADRDGGVARATDAGGDAAAVTPSR